MKLTAVSSVLLAGSLLSGCATSTEPMRFQAGPHQQRVMRDGFSTLFSKREHSTVRVQAVSRSIGATQRPAFRISIRNTSSQPQDFIVSQVEALQATDSGPKPLKVYSFEDLVVEERNNQIARAVVTVGVGAANSWLASNQGYWARRRADIENDEAAEAVAAAGQRNLAALEALILKDTTVLPGETYSGLLFVDPPAGDTAEKVYTIRLRVGSDLHQITTTQGRAPVEAATLALAQASGPQANIMQEWYASEQPVRVVATRPSCAEANGQVTLFSALRCGER
jgi:hypothetical protein